jgi:2-haloalkanoic acid dehalogenase type II
VKLSDFDALSFDCYGTLIDWETGLLAVLAPWARERGLAIDDERLLAAFAAHETALEAALPASPYPDILARTMTAVGEELGVEVTAAEARHFAHSVPEWPAYADAPGALASLGRRYRLFVLSNVDRASFAGSQAQLGVAFDAVVTAQDVGCYKPSRRGFEVLRDRAARMGVAPGRLLHVAQSLFHDHVPAKQLGLPTVWIDRRRGRPGWGATPRPESDVRPDWTFTSLTGFAAACEDA